MLDTTNSGKHLSFALFYIKYKCPNMPKKDVKKEVGIINNIFYL